MHRLHSIVFSRLTGLPMCRGKTVCMVKKPHYSDWLWILPACCCCHDKLIRWCLSQCSTVELTLL